MLYDLDDEQADYAIRENEFSEEVRNSNVHTAFVLSQSWCPQWIGMKGYLNSICISHQDIDIYVLEYDRKPYFTSFMSMKETKWNNFEVPYIRYYSNGNLVSESNFISKENFIGKLKN